MVSDQVLSITYDLITFYDTLREGSSLCTAIPSPQKKNQGEGRLRSAGTLSCSSFYVVFLECLERTLIAIGCYF